MKQTFYTLSLFVVSVFVLPRLQAQTNTFPATGNVGIGTLTPSEKLSVVTATAVNGITQTDGTIKVGTYVAAGAGYFGTVSNHPLYFRTNNGAAQMVLLTNGNMGIGTTSPAERFTVQSASGVLGFSHTNGTVKLGSFLTGTGAIFGTVTNHPLYLRTNNAGAQVALLQSGNFGIGTTTPIGRLDVRGTDAYIQLVRAGTGNGNDSTNTCFGRNALQNLRPDSNGRLNTAVGYNALNLNKKGYNNVAVGANTMEKNTEGFNNIAIGRQSMKDNTTGNSNTAVGTFSLSSNLTGVINVAIGDYSGFWNTSGSENVGVGFRTLESNRTGSRNTALGSFAAGYNTTANDNVAVGNLALFFDSTGSGNVAIGQQALWTNNANENTAVGFQCLDSNKNGLQNTAAGTHAMFYNNGNWNTAFGRYALYNNRTGYDNTAIGDVALYNNNSGFYNTGLGYFASPNTGALNNTTAIGYNARTTASNQVRIGNNTVTSIGGFVNWTNISDGRVKKNVRDNVPGLSFINQLKPVTYNLDLEQASTMTGGGILPDKTKDQAMERELHNAATAEKSKIIYSGFIAQDVEKAALASNYEFSGVDAPKNKEDLYGLRYAEFVVPLVKAVQELSSENAEMKKEIAALKEMMQQNSKNIGTENLALSSARLEQNVPNPFSSNTSIGYMVPNNCNNALLQITDAAGNKIQEFRLRSGKNKINVNISGLNAGTYQYSLLINHNIADTKQMVLVK